MDCSVVYEMSRLDNNPLEYPHVKLLRRNRIIVLDGYAIIFLLDYNLK